MRNLFIFLIFASYAVSVQASFKQDYDKTYQTYEKAETNDQLRAVAQQFKALSERKDAGWLTANTFYWQGQCHYRVKEYIMALMLFERTLLIPESNKEEDARYKVAYCYIELNRKKEAIWELERFVRDFPNSKKISGVKKELNRLSKP